MFDNHMLDMDYRAFRIWPGQCNNLSIALVQKIRLVRIAGGQLWQFNYTHREKSLCPAVDRNSHCHCGQSEHSDAQIWERYQRVRK